MNIERFLKNYNLILSRYSGVQVVIVTKYFSYDETLELYEGIKDHVDDIRFGENRINVSIQKEDILKNVRSHFIGPLQSNKAGKAVGVFDVIESVGSIKLARQIDRKAKDIGKIQEIYLQINISNEDQKSGFSIDDIHKAAEDISLLNNVKITGIMAMASKSDSQIVIRQFQVAKQIFDKLKAINKSIEHLSLGMSGDYELAAKIGANEFRLGSTLFS